MPCIEDKLLALIETHLDTLKGDLSEIDADFRMNENITNNQIEYLLDCAFGLMNALQASLESDKRIQSILEPEDVELDIPDRTLLN